MPMKNKNARSSVAPNAIRRMNCNTDHRSSSCNASWGSERALRKMQRKRTKRYRRSIAERLSKTWMSMMSIWPSCRMSSIKTFNANINLRCRKRKNRLRRKRLREATKLRSLKRKKMSYVTTWSLLPISPNASTMKIESWKRRMLSFGQNSKHRRITESLA